MLKRLARLDVLLIDEFGYLNLKPEQSNVFFKLMEERYHRHSTIITTSFSRPTAQRREPPVWFAVRTASWPPSSTNEACL